MLKKTLLQIILVFTAIVASAQIPDLLPTGETEPIELTTLNIVIYFVLPIVIFIIYFWYRKSKRENKNIPDNS
jgi:uncharacterized protein YacL